MSHSKRLQLRNTLGDDNRLKLHLRLMTVGKTTYRVVTLRPGTDACFSTNYFHETWHIITDAHGARLLGRLMWGLSYQREPHTVVVICGEHLKPTPFDADPSDPILLTCSNLAALDSKLLSELHHKLRALPPSERTIRWQTFGLDRVLGSDTSFWEREEVHRTNWQSNRHLWDRERMSRCGGFVCYAAPPEILREQAYYVHSLSKGGFHYGLGEGGFSYGTNDWYLAHDCRPYGTYHPDGEVQIYLNYRQMLRDAAVARGEVGGHENVPNNPKLRREYIQQHTLKVRGRRLDARYLARSRENSET